MLARCLEGSKQELRTRWFNWLWLWLSLTSARGDEESLELGRGLRCYQAGCDVTSARLFEVSEEEIRTRWFKWLALSLASVRGRGKEREARKRAALSTLKLFRFFWKERLVLIVFMFRRHESL